MPKILWPKLLSLIPALLVALGLTATAGRAIADPAPSVTPDDRILGKADAPITIFEFASLTCPHCADFDKETMPKVKEEWIDTGKARLVFRDFPFDKAALRAAMLARCAPADRYFGFLDVLFSNQRSWALAKDTDQALERIGRLGGISADQFQSCMQDEKLTDRIVAMRVQAEKEYGVDSTPTFFVNGTKVLGAQPYDEFVKALTAAAPKT
jgi:protein-disulfide isomerase